MQEGSAEKLLHKTKEAGLSVLPIGVYGLFHHPLHQSRVKELLLLCKKDGRFRLSESNGPKLRLRSNSDAKIITQGLLHEIALRTILTETCQWFNTIESCLLDAGGKGLPIKCIGDVPTLPRLTPASSSSDASEVQNTPSSSFSSANSNEGLPRPSASESTVEENAYTPIAVIGMACRFPKAASVDQYWDLIKDAKTTASPLPAERFQLPDTGRLPE